MVEWSGQTSPGKGGGGSGGGGNGGKQTSLLNQVFVGLAVSALILIVVYGVGPYIFPASFEGEAEQSIAELSSCRLRVTDLTAELKKCIAGRSLQSRPFGPSDDEDNQRNSQGGGSPVNSEEVEKLKERLASLEQENKRLAALLEARDIEKETEKEGSPKVTKQAVAAARELLDGCNKVHPVGDGGSDLTVWKGYECSATKEDFERYLDYKPGGMCPNDWYFVQRLIFKKNCFALPRRRCISVTPAHPSEPLPLPDSLFSPVALKDENVRWDLHQCKSYECLNTRTEGDCRNCFNLTLEEHRWKVLYRGSIPMKQVLAFKKGSIRLGLDVGGGTGSFAAHMALHGVTVLTTAFNVETVNGKKAGLPYMETIAQRGVVPLHWPHKARLPLYDGVLDIIHSVNSIKYIPPVEFQELIYEWNRVLRPGGLLWFEMFYAPVDVMPTYVAIIEKLNYKKLYWNFTPKPDAGEVAGEHVYLNSVLEKLPTPGTQVLSGPSEEDMDNIV